MRFPNRTSAYIGLSAYWFATSFKWFILLLVVLPGQVEAIVPGGEKSGEWGKIFALGALWAVVGPSIFGFLSDKVRQKSGGRSRFILAGSLVTAVACFVLSQANSLLLLMFGYLILQFADDLGIGPYSAYIPELVDEEHRGTASGFMGAASLLGQITIGVWALILDQMGQGTTAIYISIAVVNILSAIWVSLAVKGYTAQSPATTSPLPKPSFIEGWIKPWRSKDFFWVWFTRLLNALGFYLVVNYLSFFLSDVVGNFSVFGLFTIGSAGMATNILALVISLSGAIGALYASRLGKNRGHKTTIYRSGIIMGLALLPCVFIPNFSVIFVFASIFGVGYGMFMAADWALVSDVLPNKEEAGQQMGVWQMSTSAVQIFTGAFGTVITLVNASRPSAGYQLAFIMAAALLYLSTVMVRNVKASR